MNLCKRTQNHHITITWGDEYELKDVGDTYKELGILKLFKNFSFEL